MFSLRNRFGIPGVISVIALVFAMLGGAYAASNSSGGGKATASAKAKRGPRGPKGPTGPAGPVGPQGPAGANGKDGAAGKAGTNGINGTSGADGKSVTVTAVQTGETECNGLGGAIVEQEDAGSGTEVCNGEEGAAGVGTPWTAGGTLPEGSTETGTWSFGPVDTPEEESGLAFSSIPFSIPTKGRIVPSHIIFIHTPDTNPDPTNCPGTISSPAATSGYLCVYASSVGNAETPPIIGFNSFVGEGDAPAPGVVLAFPVAEGTTGAYGFGTYAVTGQ